MSLAIITSTPDGIVLAADSRQSYRNSKGSFRIGSDSVSKIIRINSRVGAVVTGRAFLPDQGILKNINRIIVDFSKSDKKFEEAGPTELAEKLRNFLLKSDWFQLEKEALKQRVTTDFAAQGIKDVSFLESENEPGVMKFHANNKDNQKIEGQASFDGLQIGVAGFEENGEFHCYLSYLPGPLQHNRDSRKGASAFGAAWLGQTDVTARVVLGYDPRIGKLPIFADLVQKKGAEDIFTQLRGLEYSIQWGTMTLQDGVDFATLMIETTTAIQRFSDGITSEPGDIPGVGGAIDVAVLTKEKGFNWLTKKKIQYKNSSLDMDVFETGGFSA